MIFLGKSRDGESIKGVDGRREREEGEDEGRRSEEECKKDGIARWNFFGCSHSCGCLKEEHGLLDVIDQILMKLECYVNGTERTKITKTLLPI